MFFQGDKVRYVGRRYAQEFNKTQARNGEVCTRVEGSLSTYVVEFGDDAYVMPESSLELYRPSAKDLKEDKEPVVVKKRRVVSEDEV